MIDLSQHFEYIGGAYLLTFVFVGVLAAATILDYKNQKQRLADLEAKGVRRRSDEQVK